MSTIVCDRKAALLAVLLSIAAAAFSGSAGAAEGGHKHHLAAVLGGTWKDDGKAAATYGVEYTYRVSPRFALGGWYEQASGDFDLESLGVLGNVYVTDNLPIMIGFGGERELFADKTKYFVRTGIGYTFHAGSVSIVPTAWVDWIESGTQLYFVGATVGFGF